MNLEKTLLIKNLKTFGKRTKIHESN